jgi:dipeptidyl aminopeptidase/acylaminoacyl peptidase
MVRPQKYDTVLVPKGATEIQFPSGRLTLKAWINIPVNKPQKRYPVVLFLHGGMAFGLEDWTMTQAFRDSGFVVMTPMLRGENGQLGFYSLYYDEVDDVIAAAEYLRKQAFVDTTRMYVSGHSIGGTLALLASMTSRTFRAATSLSASPDQVLYCKYGINPKDIPFDVSNEREMIMRSPLAFPASFKCPVRLYYGTNEKHFHLSTQLTAKLAKQHKLDVEAFAVEGGHMSAVPAEVLMTIAFFRQN